jgi:hypothetical protein
MVRQAVNDKYAKSLKINVTLSLTKGGFYNLIMVRQAHHDIRFCHFKELDSQLSMPHHDNAADSYSYVTLFR